MEREIGIIFYAGNGDREIIFSMHYFYARVQSVVGKIYKKKNLEAWHFEQETGIGK